MQRLHKSKGYTDKDKGIEAMEGNNPVLPFGQPAFTKPSDNLLVSTIMWDHIFDNARAALAHGFQNPFFQVETCLIIFVVTSRCLDNIELQ